MNIAARALVGLMGLFFLSMGLGFWFSLDDRAAQFAIEASSALGRASIRADFGSFFLTVGVLCGYASWKRCGVAAAGAALLFGLTYRHHRTRRPGAGRRAADGGGSRQRRHSALGAQRLEGGLTRLPRHPSEGRCHLVRAHEMPACAGMTIGA